MDDKRPFPFYFGVRPCGCHTAAMVDSTATTAADVADFARRMEKSCRRVVHKEVTREEFLSLSKQCWHKAGQLELDAAIAAEGEKECQT